MIIKPDEVSSITKRVAAGEEPFAAVYKRLLAAADDALGQERLSVMRYTNSHLYKENRRYLPGKDGQIAPTPEMTARKAMTRMAYCSAVSAAAWRMSGNAAYAEKALELMNAWCINVDTYMAPLGHTYEPEDPAGSPNGDITLFKVLNDIFLAAHHLNGYAGWDDRAKDALKRWVRAMVDANRHPMFYGGHQMYNNWEDARLLYLCKGALFLGDDDLLAYAFDRWKETIPEKMTAEGMLPREAERTRSLHYHLFAINSSVQTAAVAAARGEDLFGYEADGKNLKLAVDYVARHLLDLDAWPHPMIEPFDPETDRASLGVTFELAYARWGDQTYMDIIEKYDARNYKGNYVTLLTA